MELPTSPSILRLAVIFLGLYKVLFLPCLCEILIVVLDRLSQVVLLVFEPLVSV